MVAHALGSSLPALEWRKRANLRLFVAQRNPTKYYYTWCGCNALLASLAILISVFRTLKKRGHSLSISFTGFSKKKKEKKKLNIQKSIKNDFCDTPHQPLWTFGGGRWRVQGPSFSGIHHGSNCPYADGLIITRPDLRPLQTEK